MAHSRRNFVQLAVGGWISSAGVLDQAFFRAARARAQAAAAPTTLFDIQRVAEDTYLALARPAAIINCNAVIYVNARDVLVVDTHSKPSAAAALVAQIRREITPKPVAYVVNTHFHYDHAQGTRAYRELAPAPKVLASEVTRSILAEKGAKLVQASVENALRNAETYRRCLGSAAGAEERAFCKRMAGELEDFAREMKSYVPELPDITFERDLILHERNRDYHLVFRGRAHTASDICVVCPQTKSVATGDLVVGFIPGMGDGFPHEWPTTLDHLAELPFEQVLPGHGPLQSDRSRFHQQKAYIEELNEAVGRAKRGGSSLEETQRLVTPGTLRTLGDGAFGGYAAKAESAYRMLPPGTPIAQQIAASVKGNVAASYAQSV
jgi:glyoxylase-like metal-dependent hydrolase (beta-lactamase superfamily II)